MSSYAVMSAINTRDSSSSCLSFGPATGIVGCRGLPLPGRTDKVFKLSRESWHRAMDGFHDVPLHCTLDDPSHPQKHRAYGLADNVPQCHCYEQQQGTCIQGSGNILPCGKPSGHELSDHGCASVAN